MRAARVSEPTRPGDGQRPVALAKGLSSGAACSPRRHRQPPDGHRPAALSAAGRAVQSAFEEVGITLNASLPGHGGTRTTPRCPAGNARLTSRDARGRDGRDRGADHLMLSQFGGHRGAGRSPPSEPGALLPLPAPVSPAVIGSQPGSRPSALPGSPRPSALRVPLTMRLALGRSGGQPDDERHLHAAPPLGFGGLACCSATRRGDRLRRPDPVPLADPRRRRVVTLVMAIDDIVDLIWCRS